MTINLGGGCAMKFFIMGGSGFIGAPLIRHLIGAGHGVTALVRSSSKGASLPPGATVVVGDPLLPGKWQETAGQADVLINLVGRPILTRWTRAARKEIMESRVLATRMAVEAIPLNRAGEMTLINANAVGYYKDSGDEYITEKFPVGDGFLAEVARDWQKEAETAAVKGVRVVVARFGAVLGREGGALARMLPPFRFGVGGKLGSGKQWFSWIHMADLVSALLFVAESKKLAGVVNMCSPQPVTNLELTQTLAKLLKRPANLPVPGFIVKLILGGSAEIALKGQRVIPEILTDSGFEFEFPLISEALQDLLTPP